MKSEYTGEDDDAPQVLSKVVTGDPVEEKREDFPATITAAGKAVTSDINVEKNHSANENSKLSNAKDDASQKPVPLENIEEKDPVVSSSFQGYYSHG